MFLKMILITGDTYNIEAASPGTFGKDSIRILDGDFTVTAGKDALHAENEDDQEKGLSILQAEHLLWLLRGMGSVHTVI